MNTMKKTEAQKQLHKFWNQMHNLLIKYPDVRLAADQNGDLIAWIFSEEERSIEEVYLPTSGRQELISK